MRRPVDWAPLAGSDPVPGDPVQVAVEARHLAQVAGEITAQVARLRAIARDPARAEGHYATKLRSAAADVAGQLEKVTGRYRKVSAALSQWVPDLEHAQAQSLRALAAAQDAAARQARYSQPPGPAAARPAHGQQTHRALAQANADLAAARHLLDTTLAARDASAAGIAAGINSALDDAIANSWWEDLYSLINSYAWLIRDVCTALEAIATAAAIAAFVIAAQFVPGLDVVVDGVALTDLLVAGSTIASLVAMTGRASLAATGNGSWFAAALDAFACVTFGMGRVSGALLESLASGSEDAATGLIEAQRATAIAKGEAMLAKTAGFFSDQSLCRIAVRFLNWVSQAIPDLASTSAGDLAEVAPRWVQVAVSLGGFGKDGDYVARIFAVGERFPGTVADVSWAARALTATTGGAAAVNDVIGVAAGGVGLQEPGGAPVVQFHVPRAFNWYDSTFEVLAGG